MSSRPAAYSGRGATTSDLNYERLKKMYLSFKEHYSIKIATDFVKLVNAIPVLSATALMNALYEWEQNNFDALPIQLNNGFAIAKNNDGGYNALHGIASVMAYAQGRDRDDTLEIKRIFILQFGDDEDRNILYPNRRSPKIDVSETVKNHERVKQYVSFKDNCPKGFVETTIHIYENGKVMVGLWRGNTCLDETFNQDTYQDTPYSDAWKKQVAYYLSENYQHIPLVK